MKGSCALVASVFAASTVALSSSSSSGRRDVTLCPLSDDDFCHPASASEERGKSKKSGAKPTERFAPRFDGLRFIETLVTAHR